MKTPQQPQERPATKFPNQTKIKIGPKGQMSRDNLYQRIPSNALPDLGKLSLWGIKVWLYLNCNAVGYTLDFSPQAVLNFYDIKNDQRTSARRGINELVEKGYLVQEDDMIVFYQYPFGLVP